MTAELLFQTRQTPTGPLHLMHVVRMDGALPGFDSYRLFPYRPQGVAWAGPTYLAKNGTGWQIGRCKSGAAIAWKTVKISPRFGLEQYRMRSVPGGYKGDYAKHYSRVIQGKTYSFSRVRWNGGKDGTTIKMYEGQSTTVLKEFFYPPKKG